MPQSNPDQLRHVFKTFLGIPPDSDTPPVCGATLTSAYDGRNRPNCQSCERILLDDRVARRQDALREAEQLWQQTGAPLHRVAVRDAETALRVAKAARRAFVTATTQRVIKAAAVGR